MAATRHRGGEPTTLLVPPQSGRAIHVREGELVMLFPPCNKWLYERAGLLDHPNCSDNFVAAAAAVGVTLPIVPDPVNVFQNSDPAPDGALNVDTPASRPGDSASFRAMRDVVVVVVLLTACAVDHWPTNGTRCTSLELQIGPG